MSLRIESDAVLDADGVLHGWCWCPDRPTDRMTVEIYVNDELITAIVASRFRDDLRDRGIGDGYHGFLATITRALRQLGDEAVISARDRLTGRIFWRRAISAAGVPLPRAFAARITALEGLSREFAHSANMTTAGHRSKGTIVRAELARLGRTLVSRSYTLSGIVLASRDASSDAQYAATRDPASA